MVPAITDPFFKQLYLRVSEELENRAAVLVSGGALMLGANTGLDAVTTAMKYQSAVSYIEALQKVIELGLEIDHERYGRGNKDNGDE